MSWRGSRISVVFPTYNERDSIRAAIIDFAATDVVDEILIVNNNATAGTSDIQRRLREATGDYIVISEPDGTFLGRNTWLGRQSIRQ